MTKLAISNEEAIQLGARIRAVRKALGYTKSSDFQKELNFSPSVYYQWELGRRKPDEAALKKIGKHCGINYEWLLTGKGSPFEGIKIEPDAEKQKDALISYELLTAKIAQARKPQQNAIQKTIITYATDDSTALPQNTAYIYIQEELMASILAELIDVFKTERKDLDPKLLSKFASQIYADIMAAEQKPKMQLHLVKPMTLPYTRIIRKLH